MKRPIILAIVSISIAALASCSLLRKQDNPEKGKKLNVLFIVVDDLNTAVGSYGHPLVITPNIDRLAASGVQFNKAYCNFAVCGPSRGSFLTGLRPETIGITDNRTPLLPLLGDKITLPNLFHKNGYHTVSIGKIFHGNKNGHGDFKAWDEIYGFSTSPEGEKGEGRNLTDGRIKWCHWLAAEGTDLDQQDGQNAQKAIEVIKADRDEPLFLALGFSKPHDPFVAPRKYFDLYPLENIELPKLPEEWEPPYPYTFHGDAYKEFKQFSDRDKKEFLRSYYAATSFMDAQLGRVLDALEEIGQMDNTLILFFGDHGYHLGEHDWWNKVTVFERGTVAPMIFCGAGIEQKGVQTNAMVEFIDIYPTLAELAGLKGVPDYLEGKSFTSVIREPKTAFRSEVTATTRRGDFFGRSVKNDAFRYIEWDYGNKGAELYDQEKDPMEYLNLASDPAYSAKVMEMKMLLKGYFPPPEN